jgi:uncharacterized repeat protein (TIGR03803 family)
MKKLIVLFTLIVCSPCFASSFKVIYFFQGGTDGSIPTGLMAEKDGYLYGGTSWGGADSCGTIFKLSQHGTKAILYNFEGGSDGCGPENALALGPDGNFYGTTAEGASGYGTIFKISPQGQLTTLYAFRGEPNDITLVMGPLAFDSEGNLYGVGFGGANPCGTSLGCGAVFQLSTDGAETILYNFSGPPDGAGPAGPIVLSNGIMYGTTEGGGDSTCNPTFGCGTAYSLNLAANSETVLYTFEESGGVSPTGLVTDGQGNFYGDAASGGTHESEAGVLFDLTSGQDGWTESVLHDFGGPHDGWEPAAGLVLRAGNVYGASNGGGSGFGSEGTVFKISPSKQETILHSFIGHEGTRRHPGGVGPTGVVSFGNGDLYGTTGGGGTGDCGGGCGVVFRVER